MCVAVRRAMTKEAMSGVAQVSLTLEPSEFLILWESDIDEHL